jgi:glycosyltransferase involved in cell wall biosynthesis
MMGMSAPNGSQRNTGSIPAATTTAVLSAASQSASASMPTISVVIPVYNSADTIGMCLGSIFAQSYPRNHFEVIVVDDGSTDETASVARALADALKEPLTVLSQANAGPAAARNAGIRAASGTIVAFTDADCVATPNWLESLVHVFNENPAVAGVGGPLDSAAKSNTLVARYLLAADFYRHRTHGGAVDYLLTLNAAVLRSALLDIDGFTERNQAWAEDADLSFRLVHSGYRLLLAQAGSVTHIGVLESIPDFASKLYRYGFGNAILSAEWPADRRPGRQLVRHLGAAVLAPWLALRLRHRCGWLRTSTFVPVIVLEHLAYSTGLIRGWITRLQCERGRSG